MITKRKIKVKGKMVTRYLVRLEVDGKLKSWTNATKEQAKIFQVDKQREIAKELKNRISGENPVNVKMTFRELAEKYVEFYKDTKTSIDRDQRSLKHLNAYFGDMIACVITPSQVDRYQNERSKQHSYRYAMKKVKPVDKDGKQIVIYTAQATINNEINCMGAIYSWAIKKERILKFNPVTNATKTPAKNTRDRYLTQDQFRSILNQCPDYLKPIVLTALHTGMRKGEILELTWDRVDMENGNIILREEDTKTSNPRSVPMNDILFNVFKELKDTRVSDSGRVFLRCGLPVKDVWDMFKTCCKRAEIQDFTFHDLRHCFVSDKVYGNIPIPMIMMVSGHKTYKAFQRYVSTKGADLKSVVNSGKYARKDTQTDTQSKPSFKYVA